MAAAAPLKPFCSLFCWLEPSFFAKFLLFAIMELDNFLEYAFWTPVLLWVGLYFWFRNVSYAVFMKKKVNCGEKWAYVSEGYVKHPSRVSFLRFCDVLLSVAISLISAVVLVFLLEKMGVPEAKFGFVSLSAFLMVAYLMKRRTDVKLTDLFQSAFYLEYRRVRYEVFRKGVVMDERNVKNRAGLSFAHKLNNAESHGRFWRYVKAMARSKKAPPEVDEVY